MGTSYGKAIDYLYAGTNSYAGGSLKDALLAVDSSVSLQDTIPVANQQSMVVVGRPDFDQEQQTDGTAQYQVMGKQKITEDYQIHCYIECYRDGPDVKPVRDAAISLYDAFNHFVWLDPSLGNVLQDGRIAFVGGFDLSVSGGTTDSPGDTRMALISFYLQVQNHYVP